MSASFTMPDAAPLYPELPFEYRGYSRLSVYCSTDVDVLAALLPPPLEATGSRFESFFMNAPDVSGLAPYAETGIVIPCRVGDATGAHVVFEYVTTDDALCVGREVWGYPKKLADVTVEFADTHVSGDCVRSGEYLMAARFQPGQVQVDTPQLHPRFQVRRIPEADGSRRDQLIRNDLGAATTHRQTHGTATVSFGGELASLLGCEVVGAIVSHGNFTLDYGQIVGPV